MAKERGDDEESIEILQIVKNEAQRQQQRNINRVVKDSRGRSVLSEQASFHGNDHTYKKQTEVEQVCGEQLGSRFSLGKCTSLSASALHEEICHLSDTEATRKILENEYVFLEDWDEVTVDLLKASARLRLDCEDIPT